MVGSQGGCQDPVSDISDVSDSDVWEVWEEDLDV